jgi:hypothetical protein
VLLLNPFDVPPYSRPSSTYLDLSTLYRSSRHFSHLAPTDVSICECD